MSVLDVHADDDEDVDDIVQMQMTVTPRMACAGSVNALDLSGALHMSVPENAILTPSKNNACPNSLEMEVSMPSPPMTMSADENDGNDMQSVTEVKKVSSDLSNIGAMPEQNPNEHRFRVP